MKVTGHLVVGFDGSMRATKKRPRPSAGEVVYEVHLDIPDGWTKPVGVIKLTLPDPPDIVSDVVELARELRADPDIPTK